MLRKPLEPSLITYLRKEKVSEEYIDKLQKTNFCSAEDDDIMSLEAAYVVAEMPHEWFRLETHRLKYYSEWCKTFINAFENIKDINKLEILITKIERHGKEFGIDFSFPASQSKSNKDKSRWHNTNEQLNFIIGSAEATLLKKVYGLLSSIEQKTQKIDIQKSKNRDLRAYLKQVDFLIEVASLESTYATALLPAKLTSDLKKLEQNAKASLNNLKRQIVVKLGNHVNQNVAGDNLDNFCKIYATQLTDSYLEWENTDGASLLHAIDKCDTRSLGVLISRNNWNIDKLLVNGKTVLQAIAATNNYAMLKVVLDPKVKVEKSLAPVQNSYEVEILMLLAKLGLEKKFVASICGTIKNEIGGEKVISQSVADIMIKSICESQRVLTKACQSRIEFYKFWSSGFARTFAQFATLKHFALAIQIFKPRIIIDETSMKQDESREIMWALTNVFAKSIFESFANFEKAVTNIKLNELTNDELANYLNGVIYCSNVILKCCSTDCNIDIYRDLFKQASESVNSVQRQIIAEQAARKLKEQAALDAQAKLDLKAQKASEFMLGQSASNEASAAAPFPGNEDSSEISAATVVEVNVVAEELAAARQEIEKLQLQLAASNAVAETATANAEHYKRLADQHKLTRRRALADQSVAEQALQKAQDEIKAAKDKAELATKLKQKVVINYAKKRDDARSERDDVRGELGKVTEQLQESKKEIESLRLAYFKMSNKLLRFEIANLKSQLHVQQSQQYTAAFFAQVPTKISILNGHSRDIYNIKLGLIESNYNLPTVVLEHYSISLIGKWSFLHDHPDLFAETLMLRGNIEANLFFIKSCQAADLAIKQVHILEALACYSALLPFFVEKNDFKATCEILSAIKHLHKSAQKYGYYDIPSHQFCNVGYSRIPLGEKFQTALLIDSADGRKRIDDLQMDFYDLLIKQDLFQYDETETDIHEKNKCIAGALARCMEKVFVLSTARKGCNSAEAVGSIDDGLVAICDLFEKQYDAFLSVATTLQQQDPVVAERSIIKKLG